MARAIGWLFGTVREGLVFLNAAGRNTKHVLCSYKTGLYLKHSVTHNADA